MNTPTDVSTDEITWFKPELVCVVEYMSNTKNSLRQPVFKGIRDDVLGKDCKVREYDNSPLLFLM